MIEVSTLKNQIISRFLFDYGFELGEKEEGLPGIKEAVAGCLDAIYAINGKSRGLSDSEWHVKPDATPFQKLQAAFRSVIRENAPLIAEAERGDLVEYYSFLKIQKNEKLKESRLRFWAALPGADVDLPRLRMCSGNDVETLFNIWIEEHPECLKIKKLTIIYQHLDYLPPEIGLFTSLERLDLSNNRLEELPREIGSLASLLFLCLNRNNLEKGLPPEVGMLSSLKYLEANHCKLKTLPDEIGGLTQLEVLYLLKNQLKELPAEIGNLSQLKHLNADFNCLEELPPEIGRVSMLEILHLEGNPKLEKMPSEIRDLKNLTLLHLPRGIEELPREIGYLTQLENLIVTQKLIDSLPKEIRKMASSLGLDKRCVMRMTQMGLLANPLSEAGEGA